MVNRPFAGVLVSVFTLMLGACASIPGKTGAEQVITIDELVEKSLADLEKQSPQTKEEIANSVGYAVMSNKITKIPVVGAGSGYGVAIDNKTGEKTYLRMRRVDFGAGWGARSVRPVVIFQDQNAFEEARDGLLQLRFGTEASAKVGEVGAAGGAGSGSVNPEKKGYTSYLLTDAGVSATASVAVIRIKAIKLKRDHE